MKLTRKTRGAINVFLTLILVPVLIISCLFVDASRTKLARGVISSAGDLTLNTALTRYDENLNDAYGLLASAQDVDSFLAAADTYFMACVSSQGVDHTDTRQYVDQIYRMINGTDTSEVDLLGITETEGGKFTISAAPNGTLKNPAMVKKEVVEFMKYRAPINSVADLLKKFQDSADSLMNADKDGDLIDKKQKFLDAESDFMDEAMQAYDALYEYEQLGLSASIVDDIKKNLTEAETTYRECHEKMVRDLYNTEGLSFTPRDINYTYTVQETDVNKEQINGYIHNNVEAMDRFLRASTALDNVRNSAMPDYDSARHYPVQYWRAYNEAMSDHNIYREFVDAANSLIKNIEQLKTAYGLLTDEEKEETYTVNVSGTQSTGLVATSGMKTRREHVEALVDQYNNVRSNKILDNDASYSYITNKLSDFQRDYGSYIDPTDTNNRIAGVYNTISNYYDTIEKADGLLKEVNNHLGKAKTKAEEYQKDFTNWNSAASGYNSQLSKQEQEIIQSDYVNTGKVEKVSPDDIQELMDRINNIRSLLGNIKKAIDGFKYNGTSIRKIDSYATFRKKSGVNEERITYIKSELKEYAENTPENNGSFRFTKSDTVEQLSVTNNNHPDMKNVEEPAFHRWLMDTFRTYQKEKNEGKADGNKKQAKEDKKSNEEKYDEDIKNASEESDSSAAKDISALANLPSGDYSAALESGLISKDVSKISSFVSNILSNFGGTVKQSAVNLRDDLYALDYITGMFSHGAYENETKYRIARDLKKNVSMENYQSVYGDSAVTAAWTSVELTETRNKTLTNKLINATNNYAYGAEIEYILYGNTNEKNLKSARNSIFAFRFVLNLPAEFQKNWSGNSTLNEIAYGIQAASYGVIPEALVKLVVIIGLTAAESARDVKYLKAGMPMKLVKGKDDLEILFPTGVSQEKNREAKNEDGFVFSYSDYLKLFLFVKLIGSDEYMVYARTMDVIQANMIHTGSSYVASRSIVYYQASATLRVKPLMLALPTVENEGYGIQDGGWNTISYKQTRGY